MRRLRAEATTAEVALHLISLAARLVDAGASAMLIEGPAAEVPQVVTERSLIPVIGCGSGGGCDGQIPIAPDILGLTEAEAPRFAKAYAELSSTSIDAFRRYADEGKSGRHPDADHSCHMKTSEMDRLKSLLHP